MSSFDALSPHWPEISALLDQALALPPQERPAWLASLAGAHAEFRDSLRVLLEVQASVETGSFMDTLPKVGAAPSDAGGTDAHPGTLVGPYRLVSELGRGGMGAVWLAERADGQLKRRVALKLPHLAWTSALGDRLARERDILATLAHPNIARLYDAGVDQHGRPYFAMELVEGEPIDTYCRAHDLALTDRIRLLLQVCDAVAHAHARLVVHRDLKPGNILVTADGEVRLLDFGIAKLMEGDHTEETALTQVSGRALTLDYASPEQIRGEPLGTASDVYSLGVVAYELLTGSRPYRLKRGSAAELEEAIASADPPRASDAAAEPALKKALRGDVDAILNKALKKNVVDRYATVEAFAQDLQRHLDQEPVLAQPDRITYRMGKFVRRHRLKVAAAGLVAFAMLGGAAVTLWQAQLARAQAARAEDVKRFVLSIFRDADSEGGGSRKTSAVDLLKQARTRLAATPITDPATRVEVLTSVGYSLIGQGEPAAARDVMEQAVATAHAELDTDALATAHAKHVLGEILVASGDLKRAASMLDAAENGMRRHRDMTGLVHTLRQKAYLRSEEGHFDQGIATAREAVALAETHLATTNRDALRMAYMTLSRELGVTRRPDELEYARKAYQLANELYGQRIVSPVLEARSLYAHALVNAGQATEGAAELKDLIAQQTELFGPDHINVGASHQRLAFASTTLGDAAAAVEAFREALRIERVRAGPRVTPEVALQRMNFGQSLLFARRVDAAEPELRGAAADFASLSQANPAYVRLSQAEVAVALTRSGRLAEADEIFAKLSASPATHPMEGAALKQRLGTLRSRQARHAEAVTLLQECVAFATQLGNENVKASMLVPLGLAQVEADRPADALATLAPMEVYFTRLHRKGSPVLAQVRTAIARAQLALGRPAEALAASTLAVDFWRAFPGADRDTGVALAWHARSLHANGQIAKARDALREASDRLAGSAVLSEQALLHQVRGEIAAAQAPS